LHNQRSSDYGLFNNPKNRSGFHEVIGKELIVFIEVYMICSLSFRELQLCKNLFFSFENHKCISEIVIFFQFSDIASLASIPKRDLALDGNRFLEPV